MQLDHLQKILSHVKKGLACPRCQEVFGAAEIRILAIREKKIDLFVLCPHCLTEARIAAEVSTQKKRVFVPPKGEEAEISTQAHITPENVEGLRRTIGQLSASDIEHLDTEKE